MRIAAFLENIAIGSRESGRELPELLRDLKKEGLESVYLCRSWWMGDREDWTLSLLNQAGLTLEGLWDSIAFNTLTPEEGEASFKDLINCARRNGAGHVLIVPGFFREEGRLTREEVKQREPELSRMIEGMRAACRYGKEQGVAVTMEDYDGFTSPIVFPEVLRRFFEEIPELKISFDTGNFVPCGADVLKEFQYYRDRIATLHLKDRTRKKDEAEKTPFITENGEVYYPAVTGLGEMHIPEILSEMKRQNYQGAGIIELFGSTDTVNKLFASIRRLKENS